MKMFLLALGMLASCAALAAIPGTADKHAVARGKFLVGYGGCNDCHTPGWAEHGGHAPKSMLLIGGGMNFKGPWGTTYAPNLRLLARKYTVKEWIAHLRSLKTRPAMPWWTFRYLSDKDLADMYVYIRSLGASGKPAHAYVPPGQPSPPPYFELKLPPPPPPSGH